MALARLRRKLIGPTATSRSVEPNMHFRFAEMVCTLPTSALTSTPFSGQFWKQCTQFGNSAVNFRQYGIVHPSSKVSQVIRISEDVFERSAFNFGDSAHRTRCMKVPFRRSAALRQTFQIRHNAKRIRQCSCNFDDKF